MNSIVLEYYEGASSRAKRALATRTTWHFVVRSGGVKRRECAGKRRR